MEPQKIVNLLDGSDNENSKLATKKNDTLFTVIQKIIIHTKIQ